MMAADQNGNKNNYTIAITIIGILFFIFGFVTWLNATLIPYLKTACELTSFESYLVTFAFYISYFVMALPSSKILQFTGFKKGMALGLFVMAMGALIFIPAAATRTYVWFLLGLFVQGTGLALLQTASNPYVTILGPIESAAKRMSIMGVANKFAGILSPVILGSILLKNIGKFEEKLSTLSDIDRTAALDQLAQKVISPYIIITVVLVLLALLILFSPLPEVEAEDEEVKEDEVKRTSILQFPYFWLGVFTLFFYVGAEVIAVDTQIAYGKALGFDISVAKWFSSYTLVGMIIGYILGIILIPKRLSQQNALKYSAILGLIFTVGAVLTTGYTSVLFVAALGFANAIMWPALWPLAIHGLGRFIKLGSAIMIMAIAGGALIPLLYGYLAGLNPPQSTTHAYAILLISYSIIFFFASKGYKIGRR
jgi:glucose/galactose transporter